MLSYITGGKYAESLSDETARAFERLWMGKADEGVLKVNNTQGSPLLETSGKNELKDSLEKAISESPESRRAFAEVLQAAPVYTSEKLVQWEKKGNGYIDSVVEFWNEKYGGTVEHNGRKVLLTKETYKDSLAHTKAANKFWFAAFAAVPEVIRNGSTILQQSDWKGRGYNTETIGAMIKLNADDETLALVVVDHYPNGVSRAYLHKIVAKENLRQLKTRLVTGTGDNSTIASKPDSVKGTQFELADTPSMAEVRRKYEGTDQWMKAPGGELVAVHWMGSEYLDKAIKEGLPMPSIAITKHDNTELHYGEVAFIGGRTLAQRLLVDGHIYNDDAYTVPRPDSTNKQANPAQPMSAQQAFDLMAPEQNDLDRSLPPGVRRITSWDDLKQQGSHAHGYPAVQGEASTYQLRNRLWNLASEARALYYTGPGEGWVQSDGKFASVVNDLYAKRTMAPDEIRGAFVSAGFSLPDSMVQEVARILEDFDNRQREYLEAKPFQILHVGDFEAVAVPTGKVDAQTLQALRDAGLQVIEYADTRNSDGTRNFAARKAIDQWLKKNPGTLFELTDKETADMVRQVDSLTKQDIGKPNAAIDISSHTPFVFQKLGFDDLKVVMYRDMLARGLYLPEDRKHGHEEGLDKGIVKNVLESFADPVYVFDSKTDDNSLVAVYDVLDKHDNPMMASVTIDKNASQVLVNLVTSIYGKARRKYQSWVDSGLLQYVDDARKDLSEAVRLQLPSVSERSSKNNLLYKSQLVNKPGAFFELAEDEEVSPKTLFELTDEQRDGFVKKWRTDVERVVCDATQQNPDSRSDAVNAGMAYAIAWRRICLLFTTYGIYKTD